MSYYAGSLGFNTTLRLKQSKDQPTDTVHVIVNDPNRTSDHNFIAAGWDGVLRIVPKTTQEIQMVYSIFLQHPILSVTFGNDSIVFAGLATGDIVAVDMGNNQATIIGSHNAAIVEVIWIQQFNILLSLGFDNKLKFWDVNNPNNFLANQIDLPSKTHAASFDYPYLMIGTADSKITFINMSSLPNIKIPDQSSMFDIIQMGSKMNCCKVNAQKMVFAIGCMDGRCIFSSFEDGYQGIKPTTDQAKKMTSKSMKKQSSYGHTPLYGQINDIDLGVEKNQQYLVLIGTQQISFFNTNKRDKPRRLKIKATAGKLSIDGGYFIFAQGNDWLQGINDLKRMTKPKIQAVRFTKSEIESFIAPPTK